MSRRSAHQPHAHALAKARQCGARTRRGTPCRGPAMKNGRCRMHGGPSTGPRTPAGLERSRKARWVHGRYSREAREARRVQRQRWRELLRLLSTHNLAGEHMGFVDESENLGGEGSVEPKRV